MGGHRARVLAHWQRTANAWEAVRAPIMAETGLRVWNPGLFGGDVYARFAAHYAPEAPGALLALGLNPGKFGMSRTGLPFTDIPTAKESLPRLDLPEEWPGVTPQDLLPFATKYRRERSCTSVYAFLREAYGSAEAGWPDFYAGVPCPLLFLTPEGENVTPAAAPLAARDDVRALRRRTVRDALRVVKPRAVLFLGKDVARVTRDVVEDAMGPDAVLTLDHPVARGPGRRGPQWWARTTAETLRAHGLLPA